MTKAKIIPSLKNNQKVTAALNEYGLRFEDISILSLKGNRWEALQSGRSDKVAIHIIGNNPKLIVSL